jgi:hypothetical protein
MQEQHQCGTLAQLIGDRPVPHNLQGLLHKVVGKIRLIDRRGTWHDTHPVVFKRLVPIQSPCSLPEMRGQPYN